MVTQIQQMLNFISANQKEITTIEGLEKKDPKNAKFYQGEIAGTETLLTQEQQACIDDPHTVLEQDITANQGMLNYYQADEQSNPKNAQFDQGEMAAYSHVIDQEDTVINLPFKNALQSNINTLNTELAAAQQGLLGSVGNWLQTMYYKGQVDVYTAAIKEQTAILNGGTGASLSDDIQANLATVKQLPLDPFGPDQYPYQDGEYLAYQSVIALQQQALALQP